MKQRPRIYCTQSEKQQMWDHWQKGDSLQQIAQLFDRNHSSIPVLQICDLDAIPSSRDVYLLTRSSDRKNSSISGIPKLIADSKLLGPYLTWQATRAGIQ